MCMRTICMSNTVRQTYELTHSPAQVSEGRLVSFLIHWWMCMIIICMSNTVRQTFPGRMYAHTRWTWQCLYSSCIQHLYIMQTYNANVYSKYTHIAHYCTTFLLDKCVYLCLLFRWLWPAIHNNHSHQPFTTTIHNNHSQQPFTTTIHNNHSQQPFTTTIHNKSRGCSMYHRGTCYIASGRSLGLTCRFV